ncbi:hypothetical protein CP98_01429 [Sphingobium yanoikuyae]|uniref:Pvc16 N-terminal domain-containing protein n=1 Tax=Sphingobium yanoikuyae TaxID=13690 RepID=A0A084EQI2_SPHYA|nr:Pvc16 family protein [Sphingobium yanoikuyae]KEZ20224.1 hypothetical protein CP98_01429 [Sphingobium yanoikuyae]
MAIADLYGVTASLRNLVRYNIWRIAGISINVSDLPPEKADELSSANLNLHLYHAMEDPAKRNAFAADSLGPFPIKESPLPLLLYYVLTPHSIDGDLPDIAGQQRLMGLAMKTFHDFPAFDENLKMPSPPTSTPQQVFEPSLRGAGSRIEIIPRQLSPEDSINFWSAAQNRTARLTAYYEVRSTLIVADEPERRAGLVLGYGLGVVPGGRPRLTATSSIQTVTLPPALGSGILQTALFPAEAGLGSTTIPSAARVTVTGTDLGDGTAETIVLNGPQGEIEIDPVANPDWSFSFASGSAVFTVQPTARVLEGGAIATKAIEPGIQALSLRRRRQLAVSNGPPRTATSQSNAVPLAVAATIQNITVLAAPPRLRINLAAGIDAQTYANRTEIAVAGETYLLHPVNSPSPVAPGEFTAPTTSRFELLLTFDPADGQTRSVRLGIAGVDSAPFWIAP